MSLTYGIIGSGALGGYYGGLLARSGVEVHFLFHSDLEHVREQGLTVESKLGDFHLPTVNAYGNVSEMPTCDVVILGLKTTNNDLLPELLPAVTKDTGCVLALQNGLDVEQQSAAVVGPGRVLGGACFLCSNKVGPGSIKHLDYGKIEFGEFQTDPALPGGITPRMQRISADLSGAGIENVLSEDLQKTRWRKLVWNIPFNGLSVALDASTDEIMNNESATQLSLELMQDVQAGAAANGKMIEDHFLQVMLENTRKMVPYDSSMRLDYINRRAMEVESIFGNAVRAAQAQGAAVAKIEMLYHQLKFLDQRNRA